MLGRLADEVDEVELHDVVFVYDVTVGLSDAVGDLLDVPTPGRVPRLLEPPACVLRIKEKRTQISLLLYIRVRLFVC